MTKVDRLQNTTKLAKMNCHLVNKAVMEQNCTEALNQLLNRWKKAAFFLYSIVF